MNLGNFMKRILLAACALCAITAGSALAQEFKTTTRRVPQPQRQRAPVEENSNKSWFSKFMAAPNKLQLLNPAAPAQYGSGQQVVVASRTDPKERPYDIRLFSIAF